MTIDEFISKWENCSGSERSTYGVFLTELTMVLGVEAPGPLDHYRIDAPVPGGAEGGGTGFIDLYKRGHFILEAKQSKIADAYGWPADLAPADIVARLVALNAERKAEEESGQIRWLRPDYQQPRFG